MNDTVSECSRAGLDKSEMDEVIHGIYLHNTYLPIYTYMYTFTPWNLSYLVKWVAERENHGTQREGVFIISYSKQNAWLRRRFSGQSCKSARGKGGEGRKWSTFGGIAHRRISTLHYELLSRHVWQLLTHPKYLLPPLYALYLKLPAHSIHFYGSFSLWPSDILIDIKA